MGGRAEIDVRCGGEIPGAEGVVPGGRVGDGGVVRGKDCVRDWS